MSKKNSKVNKTAKQVVKAEEILVETKTETKAETKAETETKTTTENVSAPSKNNHGPKQEKLHLIKRYSIISGYVIVTCLILMAMYKVVDNIEDITGAIVKGFNWIMILLKPVTAGFIFAYLIYPLMKKIEGLLKKIGPLKHKDKTVRKMAVLILSLVVVAIISLIISALVISITKGIRYTKDIDFQKLTVTVAEGYDTLYNELVEKLERMNISSKNLDSIINEAVDRLGDVVKHVTSGMLKSVSNITGAFTVVIITIVFTIYFLLDGENLLNYWKRALKAVLPKKHVAFLSEFVHDADTVFSGYIRGQVIDAILMGVSVTVAFSIVNIKYAALIGLLTGVGNLVPYFGPILGYGSTIIVGIATADYKHMIIALIVLCVIQFIDGNIVNPMLLGNQIQIHPLLVVLSLFIGGKLSGIVGMLFAVPCGALVKVWFDKFVKYMEKRKKIKQA